MTSVRSHSTSGRKKGGKREIMCLLSMEPWGLRPKKVQTRVAVPPAPVRVPSQRLLAPSVASVTSVANNKGEYIQGIQLCVPQVTIANILSLRRIKKMKTHMRLTGLKLSPR